MNTEGEERAEIKTLLDEFDNYFANTIIPQIYIDAGLILRRFTPPAMKQFDLREEHLGKPILDVLDNFRFPSFVDNVKQVIEHKNILEKEVQTTDLKWYQMNILPYIRRQDNKIDGVIITFVDITARIHDLKEQEKLVAENEIIIDTLVHDIKGPLSVLSMAASELKKSTQLNKQDFDKILDILDTTVGKMVKFINEITENRHTVQEHPTHSELLDLENILEDVLLSLRDQIHKTGAIVNLNIETSQVNFTRRKLRSILYNLILNSIKYKSPDRIPEIAVKSVRKGEYVAISVQDNGMGIKKSLHQKVFDKYFRENSSVEGSGIGLHLVKQLITNAGGKVELDSTPGKGTEVTIYIRSTAG